MRDNGAPYESVLTVSGKDASGNKFEATAIFRWVDCNNGKEWKCVEADDRISWIKLLDEKERMKYMNKRQLKCKVEQRRIAFDAVDKNDGIKAYIQDSVVPRFKNLE